MFFSDFLKFKKPRRLLKSQPKADQTRLQTHELYSSLPQGVSEDILDAFRRADSAAGSVFGKALLADHIAAIDSAYLRSHEKQDPAGLNPLIRPCDQSRNTIASAVDFPKTVEAAVADAGMESPPPHWTMFPPASKVFVCTTKNESATREISSRFRRISKAHENQLCTNTPV